jgi:hypothetical protein
MVLSFSKVFRYVRCSPPHGGKGFPILALTTSILKDFTAEVQRVRGDQARLSVRDEAPKGSRQFSFGYYVESTKMVILGKCQESM